MKTASFSQTALNNRLKKTLSDAVWGTIGPESKAAAKELADLLGREEALFCSSHAGAAETILRALEVSYGDEVILPAVCSRYLKEAVEALGAKPVFCEVDETLSLRADYLSNCYTDRTQAVFCEELAGYVTDIAAIRRFATEHDLPLIDVTSAPYETRYKDRPTAQYADVVLVAFPIQNTAAIVTENAFMPKFYAAHHCGNPYGTAGGLNTGVCLGGDMRTDEFRPALIRELIPRADEIRRQKNSLRIRLTEALREAGAEILETRDETDSAGDFILCRAAGRETCRDKADALPYVAYSEQGRLALLGVRAYRVH